VSIKNYLKIKKSEKEIVIMLKTKPLGPRGKKISKWIMISGLILVISGFTTVAFFGLSNLSGSMFSFVFLLILLGLIMFAVGYSSYTGKIPLPYA